MNLSRLICLVALVLSLVGCSMSKDVETAEKKVSEFRSLLASKRFGQIYYASADDLKKAVKKSEFVAFLEAVNRKLGKVKKTELVNWNVNYNTSGKFITLTYNTTYAEGDASEQFIYRVQNDNAKLAGYHINSAALIIK